MLRIRLPILNKPFEMLSLREVMTQQFSSLKRISKQPKKIKLQRQFNNC